MAQMFPTFHCLSIQTICFAFFCNLEALQIPSDMDMPSVVMDLPLEVMNNSCVSNLLSANIDYIKSSNVLSRKCALQLDRATFKIWIYHYYLCHLRKVNNDFRKESQFPHLQNRPWHPYFTG